jgi:hypothetical protein
MKTIHKVAMAPAAAVPTRIFGPKTAKAAEQTLKRYGKVACRATGLRSTG